MQRTAPKWARNPFSQNDASFLLTTRAVLRSPHVCGPVPDALCMLANTIARKRCPSTGFMLGLDLVKIRCPRHHHRRRADGGARAADAVTAALCSALARLLQKPSALRGLWLLCAWCGRPHVPRTRRYTVISNFPLPSASKRPPPQQRSR